jgi:hypothetical protein
VTSHELRRATLASVAVLAVTALAVSRAGASDPKDIEDLIRQGIEFRRAGNDHRALPLFKKAYDLAPTPRTSAQLGLVEMALGYQLEAERHLTDGLAHPRDFWIQKHRGTLEQSLTTVKASIGEIEVHGRPEGAELAVNGKVVGQLPLAAAVRVGEGPAVVELRAVGYITQTRSVTVAGGQRQELMMNLQSQPTAEGTPIIERPSADDQTRNRRVLKTTVEQAQTPGGHKEDLSAQQLGRPVPEHPGDDHRPIFRTTAWVTLAVAVASIGVGVFETIVWNDKKNQFDSQTRLSLDTPPKPVAACGVDDPGRGSLPVCQTIYQELERAKTLAIVGYAVGGALAVGSVVLFAISRSPEGGAANSVACGPFGSSAGVACRMSF